MLKTNPHSFLCQFLCISLIFLANALPNTAFAQQNQYEFEHQTRAPLPQRFALESAAGLGVWTAAAAAGGLMFWGLSYMDCPDDPDAPHACAPATLAVYGSLLMGGAALIVTPIIVKIVGNRQGTFGSALISGLVGLAATALVFEIYPYAGLPATLALIPVANVLGNVITFELTHTPPPQIEGISDSNFQLQPGFNVGFRF